MSQHTAEPWTLIGKQGTAIWSGEKIVAQINEPRENHKIARANAERIVACVNICTGLHNEVLRAVATTPYTAMPLAMATLTTQRDELAAALEYYTTSTQDGKDDGMLARSTIERIFG